MTSANESNDWRYNKHIIHETMDQTSAVVFPMKMPASPCAHYMLLTKAMDN